MSMDESVVFCSAGSRTSVQGRTDTQMEAVNIGSSHGTLQGRTGTRMKQQIVYRVPYAPPPHVCTGYPMPQHPMCVPGTL